MNRAIMCFMVAAISLSLSTVRGQEEYIPPPEFEQKGFLLCPDIPELNVDRALVWTDSLACLFVDPFDAVQLHIDFNGQMLDFFVISDPGQNRVAYFQCKFPEADKRKILSMGVYRGEDVGGLRKPCGLTTNALGRMFDPGNDVIYIADKLNDRILELKFTPDDGGKLQVNRILGQGMLEYPVDVAIANYGAVEQEKADLFIIDLGHQEDAGELIKMNIDGIREGHWDSFEFPQGSRSIRNIDRPVAVACIADTIKDATAIYVSEEGSNSVLRLSCSTQGEPVCTWEQALELGGNYWKPGGIAFDDYGRIYVTNEIRGIIELSGPNFKYDYGKFGEPGEGPGQFFLPSNIIIDTYHGFCEALILEMYARRSGIQTWIITNAVSDQKIEQGFYAHDMVKPQIREGLKIPVIFSLGQAYPNPFNSKCKISFDLPQREHVLIQVFNILGQEMLTLLDEDRDAGAHTVVFDAADLSSGVYFYRIMAGSSTDAKSVVFLK